LRWQELPRFSADAELIRRRPIQQYHFLARGNGDDGSRSGGCSRPRKLTPHQRDETLHRLAHGETQANVARTYNVNPTTIGRLQ
jgi:hypothetical protein